jgi:hypothetical protein
VVIVGLLVTTAVASLRLPAHRMPSDGAADPFLLVRRPVLKALAAVCGRRGEDEDLPSAGDVQAYDVLPTGEKLALEQHWEREPVFRGPFCKVGDRITFRVTDMRSPPRVESRRLRISYVPGAAASGAKRIVVAESVFDPSLTQVTGFVPESATGIRVECVDAAGKSRSVIAWGPTGPTKTVSGPSPPCR